MICWFSAITLSALLESSLSSLSLIVKFKSYQLSNIMIFPLHLFFEPLHTIHEVLASKPVHVAIVTRQLFFKLRDLVQVFPLSVGSRILVLIHQLSNSNFGALQVTALGASGFQFLTFLVLQVCAPKLPTLGLQRACPSSTK